MSIAIIRIDSIKNINKKKVKFPDSAHDGNWEKQKKSASKFSFPLKLFRQKCTFLID